MKNKLKHLILLCVWAIVIILFELSKWSTGYSAPIAFIGGVMIYLFSRRLLTSLKAASDEAMKQHDQRIKFQRQEKIDIIREANSQP